MTAQNKQLRIVTTLLLCIIAIAIVISGWVFPTAYADTDASPSYDKTNAYDDLKVSIIGGKEFDLSDYPKDDKGTPTVISFIEFGYSTVAEKQAYFGLYAYIYNPTEKDIDTSSVRNRIEIKIGAGQYTKYNLTFLNYSRDKSCEKRFYKFRLDLQYRDLQSALKNLSADKRVYEVVGVELSYINTVKDYTCAQTYTYTGYSKGCNPNGDDSNTLTCNVDGLDKYINLDVKHTEYRARGDYYNGEQSQLNSVYFRVPNRFYRNYGELTEIACEWWEYFTKPLLVCNDQSIVNAINTLYGRNTMKLSTERYYLFMVFWENIKSSWFGGTSHPYQWTSNRNYSNDWYAFDFLWDDLFDFRTSVNFDGYAAAFYTNDLKNVDVTLTGDVLLERLRAHSAKLGGKKYRDRYSAALFEDYVQGDYEMGHNVKSIKKDDKMEVSWNRISAKNLWSKMFTGDFNVSTEYDELNAIVNVGAADVFGSDVEIAKTLYINKNDVASLKNEYNIAQENDETLVLFRYSTTKYMCAPTAAASCSNAEINSGTSDGEFLVSKCEDLFDDRAWNARTVQETVYLDFDIISLTYTLDGVETVTPVISSPKDIAGGIGDPVLEDPLDKATRDWKKTAQIVLGVIIGVLGLLLLYKLGVLKFIWQGIVFVVTAPFKLISNAIERRKNKSNKN